MVEGKVFGVDCAQATAASAKVSANTAGDPIVDFLKSTLITWPLTSRYYSPVCHASLKRLDDRISQFCTLKIE
jgi:hypothetical protein